MYTCSYCHRNSNSSRGNKYHEGRCKSNPERTPPKKKSQKWLDAMRKRRGNAKNQWTNNSEYQLSDETRKKQSDAARARKHSPETKKKISESRIKYLQNNPDKVPYVLNHYSKGESFPEKYFRELLDFHNIPYEQEKRIGLYSMDFAIEQKMIDLEIDGEQHYTDDKIIQSDVRRDKFMSEMGWKTVRIRWSDYKKMSEKDRLSFVNQLIFKLK